MEEKNTKALGSILDHFSKQKVKQDLTFFFNLVDKCGHEMNHLTTTFFCNIKIEGHQLTLPETCILFHKIMFS